MSSYYTWTHINKIIREKGFDVTLHDFTEQIGILSVQGPNRYSNLSESTKCAHEMLQKIRDAVIRSHPFGIAQSLLQPPGSSDVNRERSFKRVISVFNGAISTNKW